MENRKKIELVVFDWAGTTVDYGSRAPSVVFDRVFSAHGVKLTRSEIDRPMGMEKKAHIRELLRSAAVGSQWRQSYGRDWDETDVEALYQEFESALAQVVAEYSVPIPGVIETVEKLRDMGIKIGSTTGYNADIMAHVTVRAADLGYSPDCLVTPDKTGAGRPAPFMVFRCMEELGVYPPRAVVKAGDTVMDILEGKNAGAWSVGILTGSSILGLDQDEYNDTSAEELDRLKDEATRRYIEAGADLVIDTITQLPEAIGILEARGGGDR